MPLLDVHNLSVGFAGCEDAPPALDRVSLTMEPGRTLALVGESGSGKTLTAQAIMGLLPPAASHLSGHILFDDPASNAPAVDIAALPRNGGTIRAIRGRRIALIFQEPMTSLSALYTVGNQIAEVIRLHRNVTGAEAQEAARDMLAQVGFPNPRGAFTRYPFELSGGMRQRAMIAMAIACRPALLIADEPTTALDVTIQAQILKLMRDLQDDLGTAILLIAHDLGVVANLADDMAVLYQGRVVESGPATALFRTPSHPYLRGLIGAVPHIGRGGENRLTGLRAVQTDTETWAAQAAPRRALANRNTTLLSFRGVTKSFVNRKARTETTVMAVQDVSLDIAQGECVGIVGESGSGKSTLAKLALRAVAPDRGSVHFARPVLGLSDIADLTGADLKDYRRRVQYVFQDPFSALNPRHTVGELLREPLILHDVCDPHDQRETVAHALTLVGLDPSAAGRYPHAFSGGQRQRIGIARALSTRPELLVLDEPTSALDVSVQAQVLNLLKDLKARLGLTYLFISHNLAVIDYIADRIAVMCRGRIVELARRDALFAAPRHPYTQALLAAIPEPDPERPLDLDGLMAGKASDPSRWPTPFCLAQARPVMVQVAPDHWVAEAATGDESL